MGGGGEKSRGEKDLRMRRGKGMEDTHYNNVEFKQHFFHSSLLFPKSLSPHYVVGIFSTLLG
jgi:hypothetical protein